MLPLGKLHPWVGLVLVSAVTGVVMLLIFGKTSNQRKITETKDKLKAYIMEMWIFRNDTRVVFLAIGNVIRNNLQYLRHSLRPLVFLLVPVLIIMVQLGIRYANEPFMPGEFSIVSVKLRDGVRPTETDIELLTSSSVQVLSPPLRIDSRGEIEWKIQARLPGHREISFETPSGVLTKTFAVGPERRVRKLGAVRATAGTWDAFLYPSEEPIPRDSVVESIRVRYPARRLTLFGINIHWLIAFFVISVAAGFALKSVFGIDV